MAELWVLPLLWVVLGFLLLLLAVLPLATEPVHPGGVAFVAALALLLALPIGLLQGRGAQVENGQLTIWRWFVPRRIAIQDIAAAEPATFSVLKSWFTPRKIWVWTRGRADPLPIVLHSMRRPDSEAFAAWLQATASWNQARGLRRPPILSTHWPRWMWGLLVAMAAIVVAVAVSEFSLRLVARGGLVILLGGWLLDRAVRGAASFDAQTFRYRRWTGWKSLPLAAIDEADLSESWPASLKVLVRGRSITVPVQAGDITLARAFAQDLVATLQKT